MGVRTFAVAGFTTEAVADSFNMANSKHMSLKNGAAGQYTKILEVSCGGIEPSTSQPQKLVLARTAVLGTTPTALTTAESDEADDPNFSALASPVVAYTACSGTATQRAKKYLGMFPLNALGGVNRERFPVGREPCMLGASADNGEANLSGFTGTTPGLVVAHIKYETV